MRRPFVLRVQVDDPGAARDIARALVGPLRERGARVLLDGASQGGGSAGGIHIITAERGLPGSAVSIGVNDDDGPRWLAPLEVPQEPERAAAAVIPFLEAWGFISGTRLRAS